MSDLADSSAEEPAAWEAQERSRPARGFAARRARSCAPEPKPPMIPRGRQFIAILLGLLWP